MLKSLFRSFRIEKSIFKTKTFFYFFKILLIKSDKIREKLQLEDYDKIFKKNILNSVQNFKKGQSAYLEVLEL